MTSFHVHQIDGYIETIYLVEQNKSFFLLDGCCKSDVKKVIEFLENKLNRSISDLKLVITTHAHPDHMGGAHQFQKMGIPIAGPEAINRWYRGISGYLTYLVDIMLTHLVAMNHKTPFEGIFYPRFTTLDYELKDQDHVPGFENWFVLQTPGHTQVDLSVCNSEEKIVYVADNFVRTRGKAFRPYPICYPESYKRSLKRYIDFSFERFLLAHYGELRIPKDRIQELIDSTPLKARRHRNTLFLISLKLISSFFRRLRN